MLFTLIRDQAMKEPRDFKGTIDLEERRVLEETRDLKGTIDLEGTMDTEARIILKALPSDEVDTSRTELLSEVPT